MNPKPYTLNLKHSAWSLCVYERPCTHAAHTALHPHHEHSRIRFLYHSCAYVPFCTHDKMEGHIQDDQAPAFGCGMDLARASCSCITHSIHRYKRFGMHTHPQSAWVPKQDSPYRSIAASVMSAHKQPRASGEGGPSKCGRYSANSPSRAGVGHRAQAVGPVLREMKEAFREADAYQNVAFKTVPIRACLCVFVRAFHARVRVAGHADTFCSTLLASLKSGIRFLSQPTV